MPEAHGLATMASMRADHADEFTFLTQPPPEEAALAALPDGVARWFHQRFGPATGGQRLAWPVIVQGDHLLLSAPTGTGKTLAAFLPIIGGLADSRLPGAAGPSVACLYVAPLKALAEDACRSLHAHLDDLAHYLPSGVGLPRLAVRTGDTPAAARRRLVEDPPEVLLTTPESLAVLLSQPGLRPVFGGLRWVVVDEVHALAATKRGADLALSLERLAEGGPGPQRIGLSATAAPLEETARYLVGTGRSCVIAQVPEGGVPRLRIAPLEQRAGFLGPLVSRLTPELRSHRATLIFTNTRSLAERLAWALRRHLPDWDSLIAVHHSALAAARRREVEEGFKAGRLRVVVSSTSLELGIDIGSVELAVLVHPPVDVVRLLQRVGRAGHGPGRVRQGLVLTATPAELLEAAVTASSGRARQCELLQVPRHPLDVLCQQLVGMAAGGTRSADEAFALVRRAAPFRDLSRRDFDDCLAYLFGLDRETEPWLPARLQGDTTSFSIRDEATARLLRRNLGTILAEESVAVLLQPAGAPVDDIEADPPRLVGTVDEGFAERLQPGDRFLLDGRCLECRRRDAGAVLVDEVLGRPRIPRWAGEGLPLSPELARRLFVLRTQAVEALRDGPEALARLLQQEYELGPDAAALLVEFFHGQECISEIPDEKTLLIEVVAVPGGDACYLHTPLNRAGNDALARVAVHRLVRDHGRSATSLVADLGLGLMVRGRLEEVPDLVRTLLAVEGFDADLDAALADSDALRSRFQRVAQTGLMLLRNPLGRRRRVGGRDWGGRHLFDQVRDRDPAFILIRQALRELRTGPCDADAARAFVEEVRSRAVRCRRLARVSPFVEGWTQLEAGAAESAETPAEALRRLHATLMEGGTSDACAG